MAPNSVTVGGFTPIACALGVGLDHGDANGNGNREKEEVEYEVERKRGEVYGDCIALVF